MSKEHTVEEIELAKKEMLEIMNEIPRVRPMITVLDALECAEEKIKELEAELQACVEAEDGASL